MEACPGERIVYFGDTARVPYGTKSAATVRRYAMDNTSFLLGHGIKMLIVACNTASAVALDDLQKLVDIPVIGVIKPGAEVAAGATRTGRIGVIGTEATINSGAYAKEIKRFLPSAEVVSKACPLLVPLAEEGWVDREATRLIAREYLAPMKESEIDTLILGCTHYPVLRDILEKEAGNDIVLIDSAGAVSTEVRKLTGLQGRSDVSHRLEMKEHKIFVSDLPAKFNVVGSRFLGTRIDKPEVVDVEGRCRNFEGAQC